MKSNLTFQIFSSVKQLPTEWDNLAQNIFLTVDYLTVLEQAAPKNMVCHYIGLYNNTALVGIAISQFLDLGVVKTFGERDNCIKTKIRDFVFKKFSSNVLVIGNNMLTGQNGCFFRESLPPTQALILIKEATAELKKIFLEQKIKIHLLIFKDFNTSDSENLDSSEFRRFFKFSTQPNMVLNSKNHWNSFEDYIGNLNKKYRDQYKRARKKAEGIDKKRLSLEEIGIYKTRIYELYLNVSKNAPFNTFYLTENHFEIFKKSLGSNFLFYGYFINNELIGFNTLIKNGKDIDTYFLGYDETFQREKMLYLNMLYDMVAFSINKGYNRIIFARTALEIKSSVGATAETMYSFMEYQNPIVNKFVPFFFKYLEPKTDWIERSPFK